MLASLLLLHTLPQTGRVEVSTVGSSGPWTEVWLTDVTPMDLAQFTFSGPSGALYCDESRMPTLDHFGTDYWLRAAETFWELWGFAHLADINGVVHVTTNITGVSPQGLVSLRYDDVAIGCSFPLEVESAEVSEYRAGRVATTHYGRVTEVEVSFLVPPEVWSDYQRSPLLLGHGAMHVVTREDISDLSEADLAGGFICYPIEVLEVLNEGPEDVVVVRLRATMEDRT